MDECSWDTWYELLAGAMQNLIYTNSKDIFVTNLLWLKEREEYEKHICHEKSFFTHVRESNFPNMVIKQKWMILPGGCIFFSICHKKTSAIEPIVGFVWTDNFSLD